MKNFCISNTALEYLFIVNLEEEEEDEEDGFRDCALKIHAPSLLSLIYKGRVAKDYVLSSFPTLVEAEIDLFFEEYGVVWQQERDYGAAVSKFLQALAHVVRLTISDRTLQVLSAVDDVFNSLPSYYNLKKLCLTRKVTADDALFALLEKAPNLVSLEFEQPVPFPGQQEDSAGDDGGEDNHYNDAAEFDGWAFDIMATRCSFLHLNLVSFNRFTGNTREMAWLKLILKNAKALEAMVISWDPISYMNSENVMADILSFPRASARCVFL